MAKDSLDPLNELRTPERPRCRSSDDSLDNFRDSFKSIFYTPLSTPYFSSSSHSRRGCSTSTPPPPHVDKKQDYRAKVLKHEEESNLRTKRPSAERRKRRLSDSSATRRKLETLEVLINKPDDSFSGEEIIEIVEVLKSNENPVEEKINTVMDEIKLKADGMKIVKQGTIFQDIGYLFWKNLNRFEQIISEILPICKKKNQVDFQSESIDYWNKLDNFREREDRVLVFLDCDGVLNRFCEETGEHFTENVDEELLRNLKQLSSVANLFFVLSSSWRQCDELYKVLCNSLEKVGIRERLIGKTIDFSQFKLGASTGQVRAFEILHYLNTARDSVSDNTVWIAIDDMDMSEVKCFEKHFVLTKPEEGFTLQKLVEAKKQIYLNKLQVGGYK